LTNQVQSISVGQKSIKYVWLKNFAFALICLATLLLILDIIDIKMAFGKYEVGLWDNMPSFFIKAMFLAYPILLVTSCVLFIVTKKIKSKLDFVPKILFLVNGLVVVVLLVIYVAELVKNL